MISRSLMQRTARKQLDEKVNIEIMANELDAMDWELNNMVWDLYWFVDLFNMVFFKDTPVPVPALTFEKTNVNNLGYYRIGRNDWAVKDQINLNRLYIDRPLHETLGTLLHEMVHSYEYIYIEEKKRTKNWYHTNAFREKLKSCGIHTDERGCHVAIGDPFKYILTRHGVSFEHDNLVKKGGLVLIPPKPKKKGKSKLKKWSCGCQNVRVGTKSFEATCKICGNDFEMVD